VPDVWMIPTPFQVVPVPSVLYMIIGVFLCLMSE
jgi:hypothetical protein